MTTAAGEVIKPKRNTMKNDGNSRNRRELNEGSSAVWWYAHLHAREASSFPRAPHLSG